MIIDNAKWEMVYKVYCWLSTKERDIVCGLYHGAMRRHSDASTEPCAEDIMETCLRAQGHLAPKFAMADGALEYEDAMAANEIVANLTTERN